MSLRVLAKVLLASAFIVGMYGLTEPNELATRAALGLIVAGVLATVYGLQRRPLCNVMG
jgi:hypothetical protein